MDVIRLKLQDYNIEWDGPIIFLKEDVVTILSPFQILQIIESTSVKVKGRIYSKLRSLTSKEQIVKFLEGLGQRILEIKL